MRFEAATSEDRPYLSYYKLVHALGPGGGITTCGVFLVKFDFSPVIHLFLLIFLPKKELLTVS
jgi:hypothetical protein